MSIKMKAPSCDDCIERIGADGLYLKCHLHRHKKLCSGGSHKVQESASGSLELKRSKADEALYDGKSVETVCKSCHPTSNKAGRSNKNEQEDTSAGSPYPVDDAVGCSGLSSSSRDKSNKKIKLSKDVGFNLQAHDIVQKVQKRPRTSVVQNQECSKRKKRKPSNWDGSYSVVIEWLHYYSVSDSDEDEAPLINKRTERRKRQKLIERTRAREFSENVKFENPTSHSVSEENYVHVGCRSPAPGNDSKFAIVPAPRPEESLVSYHSVANHEVAGHQATHESMSSPLNSPIRCEIIDISDG